MHGKPFVVLHTARLVGCWPMSPPTTGLSGKRVYTWPMPMYKKPICESVGESCP